MKNIKRIILFGIFYLILMSGISTVYAATASIASNKKNMTVGDTATITVKINAASWNLNVSGAVSKGIADVSSDGNNVSKSSTVSFKPSKAGTYTVKLSGDVTDGSTMKASNVSDSVTISVKNKSTSDENKKDESKSNTTKNTTSNTTQEKSSAETTVSNIATLKNLGITPKEYDFSTFKPGTMSYTLKVPNETEKINIYASATSSKATISGTGAKTLKEGANTFYVKVTAEDKKTTKTYSLIINRAKEEEPEEKEDEEETEEENNEEKTENESAVGLTKLSVEGYNLTPEFNNEVYEYNLKLTEDVEKLNINTETSNEDIQVDILGNEQFKEGENVVTILVYNPKDESTTTYQIIANMDLSNINVEEINKIFNEAQENFKKQKIIVSVTIIAIVVLIIIYLIERYNIQKKFNEEEVETPKKEKQKGRRYR